MYNKPRQPTLGERSGLNWARLAQRGCFVKPMHTQTEIRFVPALKMAAWVLALAPGALLVAVLRYGGGFFGGTASWAAPLVVALAFLLLTLPSVLFLSRFRGAWFLELGGAAVLAISCAWSRRHR